MTEAFQYILALAIVQQIVQGIRWAVIRDRVRGGRRNWDSRRDGKELGFPDGLSFATLLRNRWPGRSPGRDQASGLAAE